MRITMFLILLVTMPFTASMTDRVMSEEASEAISSLIKDEEWRLECNRRTEIIEAIVWVESRGNALAFNRTENAASILQIRPIMVREANQLVGYEKYTNVDRWDTKKAKALFIDYQNKVNPEWDAKMAARKWNGGRSGHLKLSTIKYWTLVKNRLKYDRSK